MTPERWNRIQEVFAAVLERKPEAQAAYLREACAGDSDLAKEVEALLESHRAAASQFLESPAIDLVSSDVRRTGPALKSGARLGPYEIVSPLGAGGMGEVYRARDTRLAREVAIKVLPAALASDHERLKRFEKEARSASALNHPNIVTIFDIGSEAGVSYIAMELVDGSTLRDVLAGAALPIKKLMQMAPQIAEGLARAHEAGIVHRDLKPENVMVKKDGLVKILDFGLAKLSSTGSGSDEGSQLPTMTGTQPGVVVGTVSYMSPEQASGQTVDFRSDQFSLGSMLYEMATGKRAFQRKTAIDTLAAILNEEPEPIPVGDARVPAPLRWIIERCLAKEPRQRYGSSDDLARDLTGARDRASEIVSSPGSVAAAPSVSRRNIGRWAAIVMAGSASLIAVGALSGRWFASRVETPIPTIRKLTFRRGNILTARFGPDGRTVAYGAAFDGAPMEAFTVRTDSLESVPMGLGNAVPLAVSSEGELALLLKKHTLRLTGAGTLARMPLGGGTPRELLENVLNADWAPNGRDLAVVRELPGGKNAIEYPIGTVLASGSEISAAVRVSRDGERIVFMDGDAIVSADRKGKRSVLSKGWVSVNEWAWSPKGDEVIFAGTRSGDTWSIFAVSLSGRERVLLASAAGATCLYDVASDGRLLVEFGDGRGEAAGQRRGENRERELTWLWASSVKAISEDGIAVLLGGFLRRTDGESAIRVGEGEMLGLSGDGRWVLALRDDGLVMVPAGPGSERKIVIEGVKPSYAWILPGGKGFLLIADDQDGKSRWAVVGPEGGKPRPIQVDEYAAHKTIVISPDGDRLAHPTDEGRLKLVPLAGGQTAVVPGPALDRRDDLVEWSADGRFLYVARQGDVPAVVDRIELSTGRREAWKKLTPADAVGVQGVNSVHVSRDGQSYAYSYFRALSSVLYILEGVK